MHATERQRLQPDVRRELLLDAAERAFGKHGVEGTRVEDIASEASVATGLLYRHFSSREALLDAVMERRARRFMERLRAGLEQAEELPPSALVSAGLRIWLDQIVGDVADGQWIPRVEATPCARFRQQTRDLVASRVHAVAPTIDLGTAAIVTAILESVAEAAGEAWNAAGRPVDEALLREIVTSFCLGGLSRLAGLLDVDVVLSET